MNSRQPVSSYSCKFPPNANHSPSPRPNRPQCKSQCIPKSQKSQFRQPQTPPVQTPRPPSPRPNRPQCKSQCIPKSQKSQFRHLPVQTNHHPQIPKIPVQTSSDNLRQSKKHRIQIVGISPRTRLTSSPSAAYPAQRPADPTTCAPHLQSATAATLVRATKKHQSRDKNSPPPPPTSLSTPPTHANYRLQMKISRFPARFHALSWLSPPCSSHNL